MTSPATNAIPNLNSTSLVRRIIVAILTGTLPEEYTDDATRILVQALSSPDDEIRALSIVGLHEIGNESPTVIPALTGAVHDSCDQVRKRAVRTLGDYGAAAVQSLTHLMMALRDPTPAVRMEAMNALGRIGPDAAPAILALIPLLGHDDTRVRTIASATIKKIGRVAIPDLVDALADPDAIIRERAAHLIGKLKVKSDRVIEALLESCSDPDYDVRRAARGSLEFLEATEEACK